MFKALEKCTTLKDFNFKSNKTFIFLLLSKELLIVSKFFEELDEKRIDIYYLMGQGCQAVWGYQGEAGSSFGSSISELFLKRNDSRISIIRSSLKNIVTTDGVIDLKKIKSIKKDFDFEVNVNQDYEKRNLAIAYLLVKYDDRPAEDSLLEIMQSFADIEGEGLREIIELIKLKPSVAQELSRKNIWQKSMSDVLSQEGRNISRLGYFGAFRYLIALSHISKPIPFEHNSWLNIWMLAILNNTQRTSWPIVHALMFDPQFGKSNLMELFLAEFKKARSFSNPKISFFNHEIVKEHLHEFLMIENKYTEYDDSLVNRFRSEIADLIDKEENDNNRMLLLVKIGMDIFDPTIVNDSRVIEVYKFLCRNQHDKLLDFISQNQDILYQKISKETITVLSLFIFIQDTRFMIQLLDMGVDFLTNREGRQFADLLEVYSSPRTDKLGLVNEILSRSQDFNEESYFLKLINSNEQQFNIEFRRFIIDNVYTSKKEKAVAKIIHFLINNYICRNFDILGTLLKHDFECFKWFVETMKKYLPDEMLMFFINSDSSFTDLIGNRVLLETEIKKYFQKVIFSEDSDLESNLSFLINFVFKNFKAWQSIPEKFFQIFEIPCHVECTKWFTIFQRNRTHEVEYKKWFRAISRINSIEHNLIHPNVFLKFYEKYRQHAEAFSFLEFAKYMFLGKFLVACFNFFDDSGENFIDKMIEHKDYDILIDLLIKKDFIQTIKRQQNSFLQRDLLRLINKILIKMVENKTRDEFCVNTQDKLIKILLIIDSLSQFRYSRSFELPVEIRLSLYESGFSILDEELLTFEEKQFAMPANMIKYIDDLFNLLVVEESAKKKAFVIGNRLRATICKVGEKESVGQVLSKITTKNTYEFLMTLMQIDKNLRDRFIYIFESMIELIMRFPPDSIKAWSFFLKEDKADLWSCLKDALVREQGAEEWDKLLNKISKLLEATMDIDLVTKFNKLCIVQESNNVLNVNNRQPVTMSNSSVGRPATKKSKK